jgi:Rrf2 family transcriptional regulator, iron-sulfur cluster assembly transcription factor
MLEIHPGPPVLIGYLQVNSIFSKFKYQKYEFTRSDIPPRVQLPGVVDDPLLRKEHVMRLSTKGRFAVTAMIDVALREQTGPVSLAAISVRHQISLSYLEQLFSKLRHQGLVESTRGPGGGYTLGRTATTITVADIIGAVEPPPVNEEASGAGTAEAGCAMTQELWDTLNSRMSEYLQSITLQHLADEQRARGVQIERRPATQRGVFALPKPERTRAPNSVFALASALALPR